MGRQRNVGGDHRDRALVGHDRFGSQGHVFDRGSGALGDRCRPHRSELAGELVLERAVLGLQPGDVIAVDVELLPQGVGGGPLSGPTGRPAAVWRLAETLDLGADLRLSVEP